MAELTAEKRDHALTAELTVDLSVPQAVQAALDSLSRMTEEQIAVVARHWSAELARVADRLETGGEFHEIQAAFDEASRRFLDARRDMGDLMTCCSWALCGQERRALEMACTLQSRETMRVVYNDENAPKRVSPPNTTSRRGKKKP